MSRYKYQSKSVDGNGKVIQGSTISVFESGGTTPADVYAASSGGVAVNSVTSDDNGYFFFWVDTADYVSTQLFRITLTKTNFRTKTFDDILIFPADITTGVSAGDIFVLGVGGIVEDARLPIGTSLQAWDNSLDALSDTTAAADKLPYFTGTSGASTTDISAYGRTLIDDAAASNARTTLGLGTVSTLDAGTGAGEVPTNADITEGFYDAYLKYSHTLASSTSGGTFTTGSWVTRTINTEDTDTESIGSLSSNQITVPAGDYIVLARSAGYRVGKHKVKIYDAFNTNDLLIGTSEVSDTADAVATYSVTSGKITVLSDTLIEVQHRCTITQATNGFGNPGSFGVSEVYATIELWRLV